MTFPYTTLFTRLGVIAKQVNAWLAYQSTTLLGSGNGADTILSQYEASRNLVEGMESDYYNRANVVAGWIKSLNRYTDATLQDQSDNLNVASAASGPIIDALALQMIVDSQTVLKNTVAVSSVTAASSNVGTGMLAISKTAADGTIDERIIAETVDVTCTTDAFAGATPGAETFTLVGYTKAMSSGDASVPRGNGTAQNLVVADGSGLQAISNGSFNSTSATNTPSSWNIATGSGYGVVTTNIVLDTANALPQRGGNALKLISGTCTHLSLQQTLSTGVNLSKSQVYCIGVWIKKGGTVGAGSTLTVGIKGTGFTPVYAANLDPTALTTSYVLYTAFVQFPTGIPFDVYVDVRWESATTAGTGAFVYIDNLAVVQAFDFGHVKAAIFRGGVDFQVGDTFTYSSTNDYAGKFQTFFGRFYDKKLPSGSSPTISDSLAT